MLIDNGRAASPPPHRSASALAPTPSRSATWTATATSTPSSRTHGSNNVSVLLGDGAAASLPPRRSASAVPLVRRARRREPRADHRRGHELRLQRRERQCADLSDAEEADEILTLAVQNGSDARRRLPGRPMSSGTAPPRSRSTAPWLKIKRRAERAFLCAGREPAAAIPSPSPRIDNDAAGGPSARPSGRRSSSMPSTTPLISRRRAATRPRRTRRLRSPRPARSIITECRQPATFWRRPAPSASTALFAINAVGAWTYTASSVDNEFEAGTQLDSRPSGGEFRAR